MLVDWRIVKGEEDTFQYYWKSVLHIKNRVGMVGEFLSEPNAPSDYPWINWDLAAEQVSARCTRFINVGLWSDAKAFETEVSPYFAPGGSKLSFEYELRRRALLTPKAWRNGLAGMPNGDGVT